MTRRSASGALEVTTSTHALVITSYLMLLVLGWQHVVGIAVHDALLEQLGEPVAQMWSMLHVLGGLFALVGALITRRERVPRHGPFLEGVGVALLCFALTTYAVSLYIGYGFLGGPTTQTLAWAMGLGSLARLVQICLEQRRLSRALSGTSTVEVVEDPTA